ncbi:uncharacterized protein CELE_W05F2.3 [Caenorhabditis elegans]|uniref:Transmembrane protein n=1 Tax=Caenorhabditis elegans TaxID=6239 RepID=Q9TYT8_CAEEL|nr:Transmembrane protein [Caenorhabditis elegans]CCD70009.1 Transmembrane protein [Caenorhabditis elegans]|eukprot:NP_491150.1 Uncharacterized protein CELE_W05F2.3 [Caenorhabditis elegans]
MRSLTLAVLTITACAAASTAKSVHHEPHRLDDKDSVEQVISEALKDIDASKKMIRMTVTMNDTADDSASNFFRDFEDTFSGMFNAIQNTHVPFFSSSESSLSPVAPKTNQTTEDLLTRTRNELQADIDSLRGHIVYLQADVRDWILSNENSQFKSVLLGAMSAIVVLIAYTVICKCCRRRSRLNHLAAFVNDGCSAQDSESLLPTKNTKRPRNYPSNSDEDI